MSKTETNASLVVVGRNEPCPCKSGKKYKRCCGVNATPKLNAPKNPNESSGDLAQNDIPQIDPQMMAQFAQLFQRLPRGQIQRLQALMQRVTSGKDISREAEEFEKTLPVEFQTLLSSMKLPEEQTQEALNPSNKESKFSRLWHKIKG